MYHVTVTLRGETVKFTLAFKCREDARLADVADDALAHSRLHYPVLHEREPPRILQVLVRPYDEVALPNDVLLEVGQARAAA